MIVRDMWTTSWEQLAQTVSGENENVKKERLTWQSWSQEDTEPTTSSRFSLSGPTGRYRPESHLRPLSSPLPNTQARMHTHAHTHVPHLWLRA